MNPDQLRKTASWAFALVLVTAISVALAEQPRQKQTVSIGGTTLQLGASQTRTLGEARAQFNVSPTRRAGEYFLYPKAVPLGKNGEAKAPDAVGSVVFADRQLVRVSRNLGSFRSADGQAAIENLIRAFARAPNKGKSPAVYTDTHMSGDASTTRVYFAYSDRVIQVLVFQPADTSIKATVDITEQYELNNNQPPDG